MQSSCYSSNSTTIKKIDQVSVLGRYISLDKKTHCIGEYLFMDRWPDDYNLKLALQSCHQSSSQGNSYVSFDISSLRRVPLLCASVRTNKNVI